MNFMMLSLSLSLTLTLCVGTAAVVAVEGINSNFSTEKTNREVKKET